MIVIKNHKGSRGEIFMGVPKHQATRNRQAIIEAASRAFRERGVDGVGVADVMKEAGFTHGGFYNHFASKDALAAECCAAVFARSAAQMKALLAAEDDGGPGAFRAMLEAYLSTEHRDAPAVACPTATLAVDAARQGELMQTAYAEGIETLLYIIQTYIASRPGRGGTEAQAREDAIAMLSSLVGAIVVARGVGAANPALSEEILGVGRRRLPG